MLGGLLLPGLSWVVIAFFAVGLWLRRTWAGAVQRLSLVQSTIGQAGVGLVVGLGLGLVATAAQRWWPSPPTDVLSQALTSQTGGALGGMLVAISLALGVGIFFQGALQPRIGLGITALALLALVFLPPLTAAHLVLVALALLLGLLRQWANTTTSLLAHSMFSIVFVLGLGLR
jgi:hypothetical protein